jgi:hypothetical protein
VAGLQSCDLWFDFDARAGYSQWKGGAAVNVKVRKMTNSVMVISHASALPLTADWISSGSFAHSYAPLAISPDLAAPSPSIPPRVPSPLSAVDRPRTGL